MKLLIARDTSNSNSRFIVYDSLGKAIFNVSGKDSSSVKRIKAFDSEGNCVFKISVTPEIGSTVGYNIVTRDSVFAVTVKLRADELYLKIHGIKLYFRGNLLSRCFEITDVSQKVLALHNPEPGKLDRYTLEVFDASFTLPLLAIAVCADLLSFSDSAAICRA